MSAPLPDGFVAHRGRFSRNGGHQWLLQDPCVKKILIVDDQADIGRLVEIVLAAEDRVFLTAHSGAEGVTLAERETPDLILMDLMMPGVLDGFRAMQAIRQNPRAHDCPIIAMTARLMEETDRALSFRCGAQAYVRKPFDIKNLQQLASRLLQGDKDDPNHDQGGSSRH